MDNTTVDTQKKSNETASLAPRSHAGYTRDFQLCMIWCDGSKIEDLNEPTFFECMEALIGVVSKSRIENFRSAIAFRQNSDMPEGQWTQSRGFAIRFKGLQSRAEKEYRLGQENGTIPKTRRGTATFDKIGETMDHCEELHENEYGSGIWLAYNALLRHKELMELTNESYRWRPNGTPQVRIIGGKARAADEIEWVDAPHCEETVRRLERRIGKSFPDWIEGKANAIIQETALKHGWDVNLHWVVHSVRRGKATDLSLEGSTIGDIMERGRWKSETVAKDYANNQK